MAECDHGIDRASCADCTPLVSPQPRELLSALFGSWFSCHYDGICSGCGGEFYAGEEIRADGQGGWLARCCGGDDEREPWHEFRRISDEPGHTGTLLERLAAGQLDLGGGTG